MPTLQTTTIGSLYRFREDILESIDEALSFQKSYGLDLLTDGEQRTDMVSYFAESFDGLGIESGLPVINGRVSLKGRVAEFSKVRDLEYIRSKHPDVPVKVAITGPTTLGMTCGSRKVASHYKGLLDFRLYADIAAALSPIAKELARLGAHVQIDEPFLSQGYRDLAERVALIDVVTEGLPHERTSVHVCGFIGRFGVVEHLLRLENVSILSLGFAGRQERGNINFIEGEAFRGSGKRLGVGSIAVTPLSEADVGSPESVRTLLAEVLDRAGPEVVAYAHPDCGLRATSKSLVPIIFKNFRAGVDLSA